MEWEACGGRGREAEGSGWCVTCGDWCADRGAAVGEARGDARRELELLAAVDGGRGSGDAGADGGGESDESTGTVRIRGGLADIDLARSVLAPP